MLLHEFIVRTGFVPTEDYYHKEIEPEYNRSKLDKNEWCKEWKKNGGIQKAFDYMCKEAANEHCKAIALGNENKALMEELASVKDELSERELTCESLRAFKAGKIAEHDEMAEFLVEQAEKWSATDIRATAIEMLGASGYLRKKIEKGYDLWVVDRELLIALL